MAKKVKAIIKIQASGGAATPAPPLGPVMGQHGVNIQQFVQQFNAATQDRRGEVVPAIVTIYEDRSFEFLLKTAPASDMIKKALGIERGSGKPNTEKKGKLTKAQLKDIATRKLPDLNTTDIDAAMRIIAGTCRQMGVDVEV